MSQMNANDYAQLGVTVAAGTAVLGVGFLLYKSGILKGLFNASSNAMDALDTTLELGGVAWENLKGSGQWVWDGWNSTTGLGMSQLGEIANGNFSQVYGSRVEATSAYIVIRARDFDSLWRMKETAYKAAVGMHKDNKAILDKYVLSSMSLKPAYQGLVKTADFVIIYPDGSFRSA